MSSQCSRGTGDAAGVTAAMNTRQAWAWRPRWARGTGGGRQGARPLPYARRVGWMTSIARWAQEISKWEPSQRSPSVWQGGSPSKSITMLDAVRKRR